MKRIIYIATLGLIGCTTAPENASDSTAKDSLEQTMGNVHILDKSNYSSSFIEELAAANYEQPIKLMKEYMIAGVDTISFPDAPALNKVIIFSADKDNKHYQLEVTRINNTSLNFKFELTDNSKKLLHNQTGEASLGALFFLGSESDEDENMEAYDVIEYRHNTSTCFFSVRIESGADTNGKQRAKISYGCNDTSKPTLALGEGPVLKTK